MKAKNLLVLVLSLSLSLSVFAGPEREREIQIEAYRARISNLQRAQRQSSTAESQLKNAIEYMEVRTLLVALDGQQATYFPEFPFEPVVRAALVSSNPADVQSAVSFINNSTLLERSGYVPRTEVWQDFFKTTRSTKASVSRPSIEALNAWTNLPANAQIPFFEWANHNLRKGGSAAGKELATNRLNVLGKASWIDHSSAIVAGLANAQPSTPAHTQLVDSAQYVWPPSRELFQQIINLISVEEPNTEALFAFHRWSTRGDDNRFDVDLLPLSKQIIASDAPTLIKSATLERIKDISPEVYERRVIALMQSKRPNDRKEAFNRASNFGHISPEMTRAMNEAMQTEGDAPMAIAAIQHWTGGNVSGYQKTDFLKSLQKILLSPEEHTETARKDAGKLLEKFADQHNGDVWTLAIADPNSEIADHALEQLKKKGNVDSLNLRTLERLATSSEHGSVRALKALEAFAEKGVPEALGVLEKLAEHPAQGHLNAVAQNLIHQYRGASKRIEQARQLKNLKGGVAAQEIASSLKSSVPNKPVISEVVDALANPNSEKIAEDILRSWIQNDESGQTTDRFWRRYVELLHSTKDPAQKTTLIEALRRLNPKGGTFGQWAIVLHNSKIDSWVGAQAANRIQVNATWVASRAEAASKVSSPQNVKDMLSYVTSDQYGDSLVKYADSSLSQWVKDNPKLGNDVVEHFANELATTGSAAKRQALIARLKGIDPKSGSAANWTTILELSNEPYVVTRSVDAFMRGKPSAEVQGRLLSLSQQGDTRGNIALNILTIYSKREGVDLDPETLYKLAQEGISSSDAKKQKYAGEILTLVDFSKLPKELLEKFQTICGWALALEVDESTQKIATEKLLKTQKRDKVVVFSKELADILVDPSRNKATDKLMNDLLGKGHSEIRNALTEATRQALMKTNPESLEINIARMSPLVTSIIDHNDPLYADFQLKRLMSHQPTERLGAIQDLTAMGKKHEGDAHKIKDGLHKIAENSETSAGEAAIAIRLVNHFSPNYADVTRMQALFRAKPLVGKATNDPSHAPAVELPGKYSAVGLTARSPFWGGNATKLGMVASHVCNSVAKAAGSLVESLAKLETRPRSYPR